MCAIKPDFRRPHTNCVQRAEPCTKPAISTMLAITIAFSICSAAPDMPAVFIPHQPLHFPWLPEPFDDHEHFSFRLSLRSSDPRAAETVSRIANDVSDPTSANYGKYLSNSDLAMITAPREDDKSNVMALQFKGASLPSTNSGPKSTFAANLLQAPSCSSPPNYAHMSTASAASVWCAQCSHLRFLLRFTARFRQRMAYMAFHYP